MKLEQSRVRDFSLGGELEYFFCGPRTTQLQFSCTKLTCWYVPLLQLIQQTVGSLLALQQHQAPDNMSVLEYSNLTIPFS